MAKIVLGISGGVDSAVAGLLLKRQGHEVIGLFMHNWEEVDEGGVCTAEEDFDYVKKVCEKLDIPYYSVNYSKQYKQRVFDKFLQDYAKGLTPNPDVLCNREIKFGPFLDFALTLNADYIATGHYAGVLHGEKEHFLLKAADFNKDQTYFLCQLNQYQLSKALFPLEKLTKPQVREIALKEGLASAKRKDSTGVCFIGERNFPAFLSRYISCEEGDIVDAKGRALSRHKGLMLYTRGQRKGLGLGGAGDGVEGRWFVLDKDLQNNRLIVSHGDESALYDDGCVAGEFNWIPKIPDKKVFDCKCRFRHRQKEQDVTVEILSSNKCRIIAKEKQRALASGQFAVLYKYNFCMGGGVVEEIIK